MTPSLIKKDFVLRDIPKQLSRESYEDAINYTVSMLSKLEDVTAIYQIGSIYVPGISDIDLIIALKENPKNPAEVRTKIDHCFSKYRYIFLHNFHVIPEDLMEDVFFLFPIYSMKWLYGRRVSTERPEDKKLDMVILVDLINSVTSRDLINTIFNEQPLINNRRLRRIVKNILPPLFPSKREINIREFLCRISLIKYTVSTYEKIMDTKKPGWRAVADEVELVKNNWFKLDQEKYYRLVDVMHQCVSVYLQLFEEFADYLNKKKIFSIKTNKSNIITNSVYYTTIYTTHWEKETALDNIKEFYNNSGKIIIQLPLIYLTQLLLFPNIKEIIINNKNQEIDFKINDEEYKKIVLKRYALMEKQVHFLVKNGFSKEGGFTILYYPYETSIFHKIYYKIIKNRNLAAVKNINLEFALR